MRKQSNYWIKEKCYESASLCKSKVEFKKRFSRAYKLCRINKWLDDECSHMVEVNKKHNYWTYDKCKEVALLCKTRSEFQKLYSSAYDKSYDNKWLNDICSHMVSIGNCKKRCIYVATFSDNYAYVGLTYNFNIRINDHINNHKRSPIYKHIKQTGLNPKFEKLTDYVDIDIASKKLEEFYKTYYEGLGFNILNIAKTGGIGSNKSKYTKNDCQRESLKYLTRSDFKKDSNLYNIALKNGWLDDICSHMIEIKKSKGYWTKEMCLKDSLKCNSLKEFEDKYNTSYISSRRHRWIKDITKHMEKSKPHNYKWKKEECEKEYLKYNNIDDFKKYSKFAYKSIIDNNWLDIIKNSILS